MIFFGIPYTKRQLTLIVGDTLIGLLAIYLGHFLRLAWMGQSVNLVEILDVSTGSSAGFLLSHMLLLYIADAYNPRRDFRQSREQLRLVFAVAGAFLLQLLLSFVVIQWRWGRGIVGLGTLSFTTLLLSWRYLASRIQAPGERITTLIVGAGDGGHLIGRELLIPHHVKDSFQPIGFIDDVVTESHIPELPILGNGDDLSRVVATRGVKMVVVAARSGMRPELVTSLMRLKAEGVDVRDMPSLYKRLTGKVPIRYVADQGILFGPEFGYSSPTLAAATRLFDIGTALVGLLIGAIPLALAAIAIKLQDGGPVFYSQERLGLNEKPFTIYKLRTMTTDAEKAGAQWSQGSTDPRVTAIGRFLRRSRLDELPQFYNVLIGDMAMVGPRPERDVFVRELEKQIPFYSTRFSVKPGLTGWAQVMYRYGNTVDAAEEKLRFELYAIQEMSPILWALIVLKTVQTVLIRPGS